MDEEDIHQRQKKEQKELNAKIQALKHNIPKGDKKKKKQVTTEIAQLQSELDAKQEKELAEHEDVSPAKEIGEEVSQLNISGVTHDQPSQPKLSKAQKRREKKEAEERARQKRFEEGEKENVHHSRNVEAAAFDKLLKEKGFKIVEVNPDGNCMYNSVVLQIQADKGEGPVLDLRGKTSEYMLQHIDDFLPFTSNNSTGDMLTTEEYQQYCQETKDTNSWGGQLELRAISQLRQQPVEVYQASSPTVLIGEEFQKEPIRLSYHRHQYGLGEHYNAILQDRES